jgi:DNA-binding response OmpR family regulator
MSNERLLVIDDEGDFGVFMRRVAEKMDIEVEVTTNALEFKQIHERFSPTIIALDLAMPETDGIELMQWLASIHSRAQIVIISGFDSRTRDAAERLGKALGFKMGGVIPKPISVAELRALLSGFCQTGDLSQREASH